MTLTPETTTGTRALRRGKTSDEIGVEQKGLQ